MHRSNLHYTLKYPYKHHAWEEVKHRLGQITNIKDENSCNKKLADSLNSIYSILHWNSGHHDNYKVFDAITVYLNEYAELEQKINFYVVVLPCLVRRAIDIQKLGNFTKLFKTDIKQKDTLSLSLSNSEQASILACRLLCLFPCQNESNTRSLNFEYLYNSSRFKELNTIFSFFEQIASDPGGPSGFVTWLINTENHKYDLMEWLTFEDDLRPIIIHSSVNSIPNNTEHIKVNTINSYIDLMKFIDKDNTELLALDLFIDIYDSTTTIKETKQEISTIKINNLNSPVNDEMLLKALSTFYNGLNQYWGILGEKAKCRKIPDPIHPSTICNTNSDLRISRIKIRPPRSDSGSNKRPLTCMETKQMPHVISSKRFRSRSLAEYKTSKNSIFNKYDSTKNINNNMRNPAIKTYIQRSSSDCDDQIFVEPQKYTLERSSTKFQIHKRKRPTIQLHNEDNISLDISSPKIEVVDFISKLVEDTFTNYFSRFTENILNSNLQTTSKTINSKKTSLTACGDYEADCSGIHENIYLYKGFDHYTNTLTSSIMKCAYRELSKHPENKMSSSLCSMQSSYSRLSHSKLSRRLSLESDLLPVDFLSCSSFPDACPFDQIAKPLEYNMRRRASEPIKSMLTLSSLYYLNSDRKSKINDQMRLKNQLELIENSTSSVKVVIDWLTSDKSLNNQISKLKLNTFADKLASDVIHDSMFFMFKKLAEDKEKCVIYNRKHKMNELSTEISNEDISNNQYNRMLLGCGFFPDPAPFPSLVSMATEMADQCISSAIEEAIKIQKYNSEMKRNWRPITFFCKNLSSLNEQYLLLLLWATASKRKIQTLHIVIDNHKDRLIFRDVIEKYEDLSIGILLKSIVNFMQNYDQCIGNAYEMSYSHTSKQTSLFNKIVNV